MRGARILVCLVPVWMIAMVAGLEQSVKQQTANSMMKIMETSVKVGEPNRGTTVGPAMKGSGKTPVAQRKASVKKKPSKENQTATSDTRASAHRKSKKGRTARERARKNAHATEDRRAKILNDVRKGVSKLVEHVNILPQVETDLKPLLLRRLKQHMNVLIPPPKEFRGPRANGMYDMEDEYEDDDLRGRGTGIGQDREMSMDYLGQPDDENRWSADVPRKTSLDEDSSWGRRVDKEDGYRPRTKIGQDKEDYSRWGSKKHSPDLDSRRSKTGVEKNEEEPDMETGEEEKEEEEEEPMLDLAETWLNEELNALHLNSSEDEKHGTKAKHEDEDYENVAGREKKKTRDGEEPENEVTKRKTGSRSSSKTGQQEAMFGEEFGEVSGSSKEEEEPMKKFETTGRPRHTGIPSDSIEEFQSKFVSDDRNANEDEPA